LSVPGLTAEQKKEIAVAYAQSVGEIYKVTEAVQLGNMVLQRLCEARGNGTISSVDYKAYYSDLMKTVACAMGRKEECGGTPGK